MPEEEPFDIRRILPDSMQGLSDDHLSAVIDRSLLDMELGILIAASQEPIMANRHRIQRDLEGARGKITRWDETYGHLNLPRLSAGLSLFDPDNPSVEKPLFP